MFYLYVVTQRCNVAIGQIYNETQLFDTYANYFARRNVTLQRNQSYIEEYYKLKNSSLVNSTILRYRNDGNQRMHMFHTNIYRNCQCAKQLLSVEEMLLFGSSAELSAISSCSCRYKTIDDFGVVTNQTLNLGM